MWLLVALACHRPEPAGEDPPIETRATDTASDTTVGRFRAALVARGVDLGEGAFQRLDVSECCDWASCYLFNPDNAYATWLVPRAPGQVVPNPAEDARGLSGVFRMRADEAIVAIGRTPPSSAYFSYRSYLHDRWSADAGARVPVFGSLGDSLNHLVARTGPGGPFDAELVVVTVADRRTEALVRDAAEEAGLGDRLNVDVVDGAGAILGLDAEADTFRMQHRIALFDDPSAGDRWFADPGFTIWRVTPREERALDPIEPPTLRPTGAGTDESAWLDAVDALEGAIVAAHADYEARPLDTLVPAQDESGCPQGCNRDTYFGITTQFVLPPELDAFVLAFGVNHARTGKSAYANVTAYGVAHASGAGSVHSGDMPGSAAAYLPAHPQADDLYVVRIARDCAGAPWCIEVPLECPGFGAWSAGAVGFRGYVEESTATGPDPAELIVDRAILFVRPSP